MLILDMHRMNGRVGWATRRKSGVRQVRCAMAMKPEMTWNAKDSFVSYVEALDLALPDPRIQQLSPLHAVFPASHAR
ncbi:hypothetical protein [Arthrobacter sp. TE12232]